jgi:hypothetical protein
MSTQREALASWCHGITCPSLIFWVDLCLNSRYQRHISEGMIVYIHTEMFSLMELGIFFFSSPPRLWGPTQPPVQCVPGSLSPGIKRAGLKYDMTIHLHLVPRWKVDGVITPLPLTSSWFRASLSTWTTLPFTFTLRFTTVSNLSFGGQCSFFC